MCAVAPGKHQRQLKSDSYYPDVAKTQTSLLGNSHISSSSISVAAQQQEFRQFWEEYNKIKEENHEILEQNQKD